MKKDDMIPAYSSERTKKKLADISAIENKHLDIPYASRSKSQTLDIYLPDKTEGKFPVLVHIHGGAFKKGDKRDHQLTPYLEGLKRGYAIVSINYRLSEEARFPAAVHDCKTAVRYVKAMADTYGFDQDRIAVVGGSAGGNLSAMVALTPKNHELDDLGLGYPEFDSQVNACVDWFGPTDFLAMDKQLAQNGLGPQNHSEADSPESMYMGGQITKLDPNIVARANPMTYVHPNSPFFLIQHGDVDHLVPVQQSILFAEKLKEIAGAERVEFSILNGADHGDPQFASQHNIDRVFDFLDRSLNSKTITK